MSPFSGRVFYSGLMGSSTTPSTARPVLRFRHVAIAALVVVMGGMAWLDAAAPAYIGFGLALVLAVIWSIWLDARSSGSSKL